MTRYRLFLFVAVLALSSLVYGSADAQTPSTSASATATPVWPSTDAGRLAAEWLKAVNSKDRATYIGFLKQHVSPKLLRGRSPEDVATAHMRLNQEIAPLELVNVTQSEKYEIAAVLRTHTNDTVQLQFQVDPQNPEQATNLRLERGGGSANAGPRRGAPDTPLGKDTARQLCSTAAFAISIAYVDRAKAPDFAAELRKRCDSGAFDALSKRDFQREFTEALRDITKDKHMYLMYDAENQAMPVAAGAVVSETMERLKKEYGHGAPPFTPSPLTAVDVKLGDHGIDEAKMLDGNIGYIKVSLFPEVEDAAGAAAAAMKQVAGAKALILDLRNMRGGSQEMVNLFCSYLFADQHKHILTLIVPSLNMRDEQYTYAKVNGERMPDVPVYVLTNERTFSAGEALTFILQQFKRAVIVGETTGGGGNINEFFPLGEGFAISVSIGQAISPISKGGWEKVGVVPDIKVPAGDALERAVALAKTKTSGAGK